MNYDEIIEQSSLPNEYMDSTYPNIAQNLDKDNKFCDPNFKPSKEIIGITETEKKIDQKILKWKRISDIIDINEDKSDNYYIIQNYIGDCYLISFLRSLLYFHPEMYSSLFGICFPDIGYYEFYFFKKDGSHVKVFVDDYILVDKNSDAYFAGLKKYEEELYTVGRNILIEKAFAKLKKSYGNIVSGHNASIHIVGINSDSEKGFLTKENDYIFETFNDEIEAKNIVLCGTKNEEENLNPMKGIVGGHMYSLISTEEKSDLKILKLNNPYGINYENEMKDFKLGLDTKYKEIEEEIIEFNQINTVTGDLKLDIQNFKNQFDLVETCHFTDTKKKTKIKGIGSLPPEIIQKSLEKRKNTLDALGISREDQKKFLKKYNGNIKKALYQQENAFRKYGTSQKTFYTKLLNLQNFGQQNNAQNDNQNNSYFSFLSYLNPFSYLPNLKNLFK